MKYTTDFSQLFQNSGYGLGSPADCLNEMQIELAKLISRFAQQLRGLNVIIPGDLPFTDVNETLNEGRFPISILGGYTGKWALNLTSYKADGSVDSQSADINGISFHMPSCVIAFAWGQLTNFAPTQLGTDVILQPKRSVDYLPTFIDEFEGMGMQSTITFSKNKKSTDDILKFDGGSYYSFNKAGGIHLYYPTSSDENPGQMKKLTNPLKLLNYQFITVCAIGQSSGIDADGDELTS